MAVDSTSDFAATDDIQTILQAFQTQVVQDSSCNTTSLFGYYNRVAVGLYVGSAIDDARSVPSLFKSLQAHISGDQGSQSMIVERCGNTPNAAYVLGLAIDASGDLATVQKAVSLWNNGTCAGSTGLLSQLDAIPIYETPLGTSVSNSMNKTTTNSYISKRGDCTTESVFVGDGCWSLAQRCGISTADLSTYNNAPNFCNTLQAGQLVCCSAGTLPDVKPKPNADGSCYTYQVTGVDLCSTIAAANGLTATDISNFNDGTTWGWFGCNDLQAGQQICLSVGDPLLPAPVSNSVCGLTVPGTEKLTNGTELADLNPCPLNACCNIWGQCGITAEYCANVTGPTGNPRTAPIGHNGCISNCGTDIISNPYSSGSPYKIGYYESWNFDRNCLNMRIGDIDVTEYSYIHWAFTSIGDDFSVIINDTYNQWDSFKSMLQVNKILSFGGWGFSTDPATYDKLRQAMEPVNAPTFVQNIFDFVEANGLDGVDFDWEYPGAPDIPGIPAGLASDGPNYLSFLKTLRDGFPYTKSISIAAPASYWYLRSFPIKNMTIYTNYVVYMTYDLYGQWDYGNAYINLTETEYALVMITKAGVASTDIVVGVPSYGRSFGMADPACTRLGPTVNSQELILHPLLTRDANDIWAAFMDDDTLASRTSYYKSLNFGSTVDWAVDLIAFDGSGNYNATTEWDEPPMPKLAPCTATFSSIDDLGNTAGTIPDHYTIQYILQTLSDTLTAAMQNYTDLMNGGYNDKFKIFADSVVSNAGPYIADFINQNRTQQTMFATRLVTPLAARSMANQFWADLFTTTGFNESYVSFEQVYDRTGPYGGGCGSDAAANDVCWTQGYDFNFPHPIASYGKADVANPKDTAQKGLDRSGSLPDQVSSILFQMSTDSFVGDGMDIIDAVSMPVLIIVSAVEEMATVETIAANITAEEKKAKEEEIIGGFLAGILFLIPVAGEVLGPIDGLAEMATVLRIAGTAGNTGMAVADIVQDPSNVALDIMNIVLVAGSLADDLEVAKPASLRRTMKETDIAKFGDRVTTGLQSVEKVVGKCFS
ncbi:glycoside hydrolase family 18 protein [Penicillium canariense]|uniref:chitinase n=1 Tax=Penicillium canariense TaxID=189055 RepID=A0A9W9LII7_9EURO|nr:glycoside hydrolase family 18 protein [Penicillium canariense]KAJ5156895.1 glycoside hydrolase family 18 protein [Penicillium canariense]